MGWFELEWINFKIKIKSNWYWRSTPLLSWIIETHSLMIKSNNINNWSIKNSWCHLTNNVINVWVVWTCCHQSKALHMHYSHFCLFLILFLFFCFSSFAHTRMWVLSESDRMISSPLLNLWGNIFVGCGYSYSYRQNTCGCCLNCEWRLEGWPFKWDHIVMGIPKLLSKFTTNQWRGPMPFSLIKCFTLLFLPFCSFYGGHSPKTLYQHPHVPNL